MHPSELQISPVPSLTLGLFVVSVINVFSTRPLNFGGQNPLITVFAVPHSCPFIINRLKVDV